MTKRHLSVFLAVLAVIIGSCSEQSIKSTSGFYENIEFEMALVNEPVIPSNSINIADFGAVNGGLVDNTQAFADAITAVTEKGGGKIIIPAGIWLTGPIILKSKLEIHAEAGALIRFSTK